MRKYKKCRLLPMDELQARPCEVDGIPALFHRWADEDEPLLKLDVFCHTNARAQIYDQYKQHGVIGPEFSVNVIRKTYALVEYQDGTVHLVAPELVTFTDKEVNE